LLTNWIWQRDVRCLKNLNSCVLKAAVQTVDGQEVLVRVAVASCVTAVEGAASELTPGMVSLMAVDLFGGAEAGVLFQWRPSPDVEEA